MLKVTKTLLLILTVVGFAACSGSKSLSTNPADIQGDWQMSSSGSMSSGNSSYTLSFNTDGTIAGKAGCNYYAGKYDAQKQEDKGALTINSFKKTEVKCESSSQSESFLNSIQNADAFQVKGGNQLVLNPGGSDELTFQKVVKEENS